MKLAVVLIFAGFAAIPWGTFVLFGTGWFLLAFGLCAIVLGTLLEIERA